MSKPSDLKVLYLQELETTFALLEESAKFASTADAKAVTIAARGFVWARRWFEDTRIASRTELAKQAYALEQTALSNPVTNMNLAQRAYALALASYARCEYPASFASSQTAQRLLTIV